MTLVEWKQEYLRNWLEQGANIQSLDALREAIKGDLKELSSSKMRRFYDVVIYIREFSSFSSDLAVVEKHLYKLPVIIAYDKGREKGDNQKALQNLYDLTVTALDIMEKNKNQGNNPRILNNFVDLMEAIVAFHTEVAEKEKNR